MGLLQLCFSVGLDAGALTVADLAAGRKHCHLLGVALGLAMRNVLLDVPLPIALYRKICGHEVGLSDL
jgi:hypothetical protein